MNSRHKTTETGVYTDGSVELTACRRSMIVLNSFYPLALLPVSDEKRLQMLALSDSRIHRTD
ncbi:hypothetical protein [Candidatus Williamhamiltonella defendens]|uniref:hypothetical protein n=1 Tax=Candidatus Williamhamiltonella defendens TaxID=138072 RepID=UPI001313EAD7|nr:hypothetical protein [Candidatus Hamiltonella defensa]